MLRVLALLWVAQCHSNINNINDSTEISALSQSRNEQEAYNAIAMNSAKPKSVFVIFVLLMLIEETEMNTNK